MPLAALHDVSLMAHRFLAVALLLLSFVIASFSIIARERPLQLEKALVFRRLGGPLVAVILITGVHLVISADFSFFHFWLLAGLVLAGLYMYLLDGVWRRQAEIIHARAVEAAREDDAAPDDAARNEREEAQQSEAIAPEGSSALMGVAISLMAIVIVAIWLMENRPG